MKSFSEYIKESYNFRLGGSQKKGYGQAKEKTFAELEDGDKLYSWSSMATNIDFYQIGKISKIKHSSYAPSKMNFYVRSYGNDTIWVSFDDSKQMNTLYKTDDSESLCIATSFEELQKRVKEIFNFNIEEKNAKVFETEQNVEEAYNFRLGGSQKKGFNQVKTFGELEEGDNFYWWSSLNKTPKKYTFKSLKVKKDSIDDKTTTIITRVNNNRHSGGSECTIMGDVTDMTIITYQNKYGTNWCAATSEKEFINKLSDKYGVKITPKDIVEQLAEAYNFRLGGSKKKGFDQAKTFGSLEVGDKFYVYNTQDVYEATLTKEPEFDGDDIILYCKDAVFHANADDANCTVSNYVIKDHSSSILSTSFEEFYELMKNECGIEVDKKYLDRV